MTDAIQTLPIGHYRVKNVIKAEVAKIMTLRSTAITLGITVAFSLLVTGLVSNASLHHNANYYYGFDPTEQALTGLIVAALTGGVLGALLITNEYSSGTIRTTLAATPRRMTLSGTKTVVTAALFLVFGEVLSFVSFFLGEGILSNGGAPTNSGSPGAFRAVAMTGVFIALLALMSFGFGFIFRSTAAAIAAFVGVVFVLPLFVHQISEHLQRYLPTNMLVNSVMSTTNQNPGGIGANGPVSPAIGLLLMAIYAAITLTCGFALFARRDA